MIDLLAGLLLGIVLGVSGTVFVVLVWATRVTVAAPADADSGRKCEAVRIATMTTATRRANETTR